MKQKLPLHLLLRSYCLFTPLLNRKLPGAPAIRPRLAADGKHFGERGLGSLPLQYRKEVSGGGTDGQPQTRGSGPRAELGSVTQKSTNSKI